MDYTYTHTKQWHCNVK